MEVVKGHFEDAFGDGNACGFLNRLCIVLEKEQRKRKGGGRCDQSLGNGFGQVADAGFFRVGHDVKFYYCLYDGERPQFILQFKQMLRFTYLLERHISYKAEGTILAVASRKTDVLT